MTVITNHQTADGQREQNKTRTDEYAKTHKKYNVCDLVTVNAIDCDFLIGIMVSWKIRRAVEEIVLPDFLLLIERGGILKIPYELKKRCVEASNTMSSEQVYKEIFVHEHKGMSCETFCRSLRKWKNKCKASSETLDAGTYKGFTPHSATVQVDKQGNVVQAWVKQQVNDGEFEQILEAIKEDVKPVNIECMCKPEVSMLEIPFFDMHFGVALWKDYENLLSEVLTLIDSKGWEEINIIIGQDLLHTNDLRGHTAKGTEIGSIDFKQAWIDASCFWSMVIERALAKASRVNIRYSKGNHDECTSWCFVQMLKAKYPQVCVDDSFETRRCISWKGVFIGYGHCEYTNNLAKIFQNFVLDFPSEFAAAKVREIHTGHLHSESYDNGMMVRRLASGVPADKWSRDSGYVGANKRFQIFEWMPNRLKAIYYI